MAELIFADFRTKTWHRPGEDIADVADRLQTMAVIGQMAVEIIAPFYESSLGYVAPEKDPA